MIEPEQLYNINFYQKEKFYGSYKGMHYRIEKYEQPAEAENTDNTDKPGQPDEQAAPEPVFRVITWPGPYNFASTEDEKKEIKLFAFSNDALKEICSFLNEQWEKDYRQ